MMIQLKNHVEESKKSRVRNWSLYGRVTLHFSMPPCHPATMLLYVHPGHCSLGGGELVSDSTGKPTTSCLCIGIGIGIYIYMYVCIRKELQEWRGKG